MTYRPRSSVTTMRTNFVGSSEVSAMTQTPASGPFALVTVPPISSPSIATRWSCWPDTARVHATSTATTIANAYLPG